MGKTVIRADYDKLSQLSQAFGQQADHTRQTLQKLRQQMEVLQGGDWIGKGANAFYGEMSSQVLPTLNRLVRALESGQQVTQQIGKLMKEAEDEAARILHADGSGGAPQASGGAGLGSASGANGGASAGGGLGAAGAAIGGAVGGAIGGAAGAGIGAAAGAAIGSGLSGGGGGSSGGSSSGGGGAPAEGGGAPPSGGAASGGGGSSGGGGGGVSGGGSPAAGAQTANPLLARDPATLFNDNYMSSLVGSQPQGADSPELRAAMYELAKNPTGPELERVLRDIARIRGKPYEEIRSQYDKFLKVRAQAEANARAKGIEPPPAVSELLHGDFMGSTPQMRFGQVVGDAFGIDPVFGALLSPTGGMVGPGNMAYTPDNDSAIGYHGVVHDAAGYLYNYQNAGPGYNYLGREGGDTGDPLTGQVSGVRYWVEKLHPGVAPVFQAAEGAASATQSVVGTLQSLISSANVF